MHKQEVVSEIASRTGLNRKKAEAALDAFRDVVVEAVSGGENVYVPNLGMFKIVESKRKTGYDFQKKERIPISFSYRIVFEPSSTFKKAAKEGIK